MLLELRIKNYALIDHLAFAPAKDLNVITGETGSGKSIMLGALGLILGDRAETGVLKNENQKCVIEGVFNIEKLHLKPFFELHDLDFDLQTVVRREILTGGKTRAFINDTPVTLAILKTLGEQLVDIHSQHQSIELFEQQKQLTMLDAFSGVEALLKEYKQKYFTWQNQTKKLAEITEIRNKNKLESDFKQFQLTELTEAELIDNESEELEQEITWLENAQEVKLALQEAVYLLKESENASIDSLKTVYQRLSKIQKGSQLESLKERLQAVFIELQDISDSLEQEEQETVENQERLEYVQTRLSQLFQLCKKYNVDGSSGLIATRDELANQMEADNSLDAQIEELSTICLLSQKELQQLADKLTAARQKGKLLLENRITNKLQFLAMPNAKLVIDLAKIEELNENGQNKVQFLFSANKGIEPQALSKVASGGELSRMMLVLKSLLAEIKALPTLVFDEVDSGISGQVALLTANVIAELSIQMQIICITHLPQMAAKGKNHFLVYKNEMQTPPQTEMKRLNQNERLVEIAQMISGVNPGEKAIANAKELLGIN